MWLHLPLGVSVVSDSLDSSHFEEHKFDLATLHLSETNIISLLILEIGIQVFLGITVMGYTFHYVIFF